MSYKTVLVYERVRQNFSNVEYPKDWRIKKANPRFFTVPQGGLWGVVSNQANVQEAYNKLDGVNVFKVEDDKLVDITEKEEEPVIEDDVEDDEERGPQKVETHFNLDELLSKEPEQAASEDNDIVDDTFPKAGYENVDDPLPEDWRDLGWLKMRTLALKYYDGKIENKKHAQEVLEEVEAEQKQD